MFGPEYTKIQTLFKRDERNVIMPGAWTTDEFEYLQHARWHWTEKVDGTNIRLHWNGSTVTVGGRTDTAQIPTFLIAALQPQLDPAAWAAAFPDVCWVLMTSSPVCFLKAVPLDPRGAMCCPLSRASV